jgi:membrane protein
MKDTSRRFMIWTDASKRFKFNLSERMWRFWDRKVWSDTPPGVSRISRIRHAFVRILSILFLKVLQDAITFRARGLTLTVVLAMVPMLALGTAILKGVGISEETQRLAHALFERVVVTSVPPEESTDDSAKGSSLESALPREKAGGTEKDKENPVIHLQKVVDKLFDYINRTDFATLGFMGTVVILILVASFFAHLEASMNAIWEVRKGRSPWKRGINYLVVLILLPIAMNLGIAAMAVLQSPTLMAKLEKVLPRPWMTSVLLKMFPAFVVTCTFAALYKFLPNTRVSTRFSVAGGLLAGISWLLVLSLYINLQLGVARYNAIYGSFATVPLVLLWIYMGWVIFLIGAELVFAFQTWREYEPRSHLPSTDARMAMAIDVFAALKKAEAPGHAIDVETLEETLNRPVDRIAEALKDLERIGYIQKRRGRDSTVVTVSGTELPEGARLPEDASA